MTMSDAQFNVLVQELVNLTVAVNRLAEVFGEAQAPANAPLMTEGERLIQRTVKLTVPVGCTVPEYVARLDAALRSTVVAGGSPLEVQVFPQPWSDEDFRVLGWRAKSRQWTYAWRRLGNTRTLRVSGVETELVQGLV